MNRADVRVWIVGSPEDTAPVENDLFLVGVAPQRGFAIDALDENHQRAAIAWMKAAHVVYRAPGRNPEATLQRHIAKVKDIPVVVNMQELEKIVRALTGEHDFVLKKEKP